MAKPVTLKKPDFQYMQALRVELESAYSDQDSYIDRIRAVREQKQPVALADNYRFVDVEVRDGTIADEVQRVVASQTLNAPHCTITPASEGDTAETNATKREHWTEEVLRVAGSRQQGMDTLSSIVDDVNGTGGGWCKLLLTKDIWDDRYGIKVDDYEDEVDDHGNVLKSKHAKYNDATEEAKKRSGPPFAWIHVDVRTVYPVFHSGRLAEVLEVSERPASATLRKYRLGRDADGNIVPLGQAQKVGTVSGQKSVLFMELWDQDWCCYAVSGVNAAGEGTGRIVEAWEHGYGRPPYFYALGIMMAHWKNRKVGWGVGETKRWLTEFKSYLLTLFAQVAARDSLTPVARELPPDAQAALGDDGRPRTNQRYELGEYVNLSPGEKLVPIAFPHTSASLEKMITLVEADIQRLEAPRVSGQVGGLGGAGFAMSQVLAEGRIKYGPNMKSIERMLVEVTKFLWHLMRTLVKEAVWVEQESVASGYLKATPDELTATVGVVWSLDPERPSDRLIQNRYWNERLKAGTAYIDQVVVALGDSPDEVRRGRARDAIRASDWYQQMLQTMVAHEAGRGDLLQMAKMAQQIAETGSHDGPNPQGKTGMPPDAGNLHLAPNGAGAQPIKSNIPVLGAGPGAVVPQQAAAAGMQKISVGR